NPNGTAPGLTIKHDARHIVILPGPPREMQPMFDNYVLGELEKIARGIRIARRVLKVSGLGESALDEIIAPVYGEYSNPATTILFTNSEIEVHLTARGENLLLAEALVSELSEKLVAKIGDYLYST